MENKAKLKVLQAILSKFGSQKECAIALGVDESTLSKNLKILSPKFLNRLKEAGVDVDINILQDESFVREKTIVYLDNEKVNLAVTNKHLTDEIVKLKAELYDLSQKKKADINDSTHKNLDNPVIQEFINKGQIKALNLDKMTLIPIIREEKYLNSLKELIKKKGAINQLDIEAITPERTLVDADLTNAFAGSILTDRNEPYLCKGDVVVSSFDAQIKDNDIVALVLKDLSWFIGRYKKGNDGIIIEFFNKRYNPIVVKEEDIILAVKVVQIIRKF